MPRWRLAAHVVPTVCHEACPSCAEVAEQFRVRAERWDRWGVRALLREGPDVFHPRMPGASDPLVGTCGAGGEAVLLVVDRRGQVIARWALAHPQTPDWREVDETVRWVGIQEPECGACSVEPAWEEASREETAWKCT